eukprot:SAG22_NODE_661_length_8059_cov_14.630402_5_plen_266_part_00
MNRYDCCSARPNHEDFEPAPAPVVAAGPAAAAAAVAENTEAENTELLMVRPTLADLPQRPELPAGFELRRYSRPGDEKLWVEVQQAAEPYLTITERSGRGGEGDWAHEFEPGAGGGVPAGRDRAALLSRQFFILHGGRPAATATAWPAELCRDHHMIGPHAADGLVHWVAVHPEYQGRGLSKVLTAAVLAALKEMGYQSARLCTSTGRLPAICLYLSSGFLPSVVGKDDRRAWARLCKHVESGSAGLPAAKMKLFEGLADRLALA